MNKNEILKRVKNPAFVGAFVALFYTIIQKYAHVDFGEYKAIADIICYAALGFGYYCEPARHF